MAQRGRYQAYSQLITVLKGINGATGGYWTNLGGRVYRRLILPEETPPAYPYLCLPLVDDAPDPEHTERGLILSWTQFIFGFVEELKTEEGDAGSPDLVMKLQDDITRALLNNITLGGKVQDLSLVAGGNSVAAVSADDDYGEFAMPVRMTIWMDAATLGAAA